MATANFFAFLLLALFAISFLQTQVLASQNNRNRYGPGSLKSYPASERTERSLAATRDLGVGELPSWDWFNSGTFKPIVPVKPIGKGWKGIPEVPPGWKRPISLICNAGTAHECKSQCDSRCSKSQCYKICSTYCNKACKECICGNKAVCPSFNNWMNKEGGCP